MKKELWYDKQKVLTQDLTRAQDTKEQAVRERMTDAFVPGVVIGSLDEFAFDVTIGFTNRFNVLRGVAYDPDGERIIIDPAATTYNAANPSTVSDDGLGGFTPTPLSTGSISIIASSGNFNYVFIRYLATIDPGTFTIAKGSTKKLYTNGGDGYVITVVTSPTAVTPASVNPDSTKYVYLGVVDYTAGGTLTLGNFNTTGRTPWSLQGARDSVSTAKTDLSDRTTVYSPSPVTGNPEYVDLSDHVKAVGSGLVTPSNPHGLSFSDIGISGKSVEQHEQFLHEAGIIGDPLTTASSLYGVVNAITFPTLDQLIVKGFVSTEFAMVNGVSMGLDSLTGNQFILFQEGAIPLANGTYTVFLNSLTKRLELAGPTGLNFTLQVGVTSTIIPVAANGVLTALTNFPIWQIDFNTAKLASNIPEVQFPSPANGFSNFTNKIDLRYFGTIGSKTLKVDSGTNTLTLDHNLSVQGDTTFGGAVTAETFTAKPGVGDPGLVIRDAADTTDVATIDETGLIQANDIYINEPQVWYASVTTSGGTTFNVLRANFIGEDGNPVPLSVSVFRRMTATISAYVHTSAGSISGINTSQSTSPGVPFSGTNPAQGIFFNVAIGDNISVNHSVSGGGSANVTYLFAAYK